ncbi:MAG: serine--tRNA ligase [Promethearchaeota archaeon Loki_b32]|nr:MAG: serine--tRNA ligase [Candidatus Lokiarchaeota archaeon Loki_b32]
MLDIKFIRQNPDKVKKACKDKQVKVDIDKLLKVDKKRIELLQALEDMKAKKNKASKDIVRTKDKKEKEKIILEMRKLDRNNDKLDENLKELEKEFNELMLQVPNPAFDDIPVGKDESENVVVKEVGKKTKFDFKFKDYLEIAEKLDLIDVKRAAKTSGTRFGFLKNEAVFLELAMVNFLLDELKKEKFTPVIPPVLIRPEMMKGMGYVERGGDEIYHIEKDKLYLIGTSEQIIGPMHANETFNDKELPKRYVAFSPCFRREAGSYGKDTKGIFRVHQFDKVEMFMFCRPEESVKEHQYLLSLEEKFMQALKLPYRVVQMCTGDLGDPAASKYDIEVWIPSQKRYRETHSTSNCTDFQARRLNIRYKDKSNKLNFVHTLNGTAVAIGRTIIAIIENYQQKDGSIEVPKVLQKYTGFKKIG